MKKRRKQTQPANIGLRIFVVLIVLLLIIAVGGIAFARYAFEIKEIEIEGSDHYTYEELYEYLFADRNDKNLILYQYTDSKAAPVEIPFIAKIDVEIVLPSKLHFTLYEKSVVGYVLYMGTYMYFDKDGVIVECSSQKFIDVPQVSGLEYSNVVMLQPLDVNDMQVFTKIQDLNQYLDKYGIDVEEIILSENMDFSIRIGNVRVLFGNEQNSFSEKVYELSCLQSKLIGLSGELDMTNYKGDSSFITFTPDEKPSDDDSANEEGLNKEKEDSAGQN